MMRGPFEWLSSMDLCRKGIKLRTMGLLGAHNSIEHWDFEQFPFHFILFVSPFTYFPRIVTVSLRLSVR